MEYLNVFIRLILIMPLLFIMTLIMGKRQIGELPVFDFLVALTIGNLVGADLADPSISQGPTAFAVVALAVFQVAFNLMVLKSRRIGQLVTFEPTIVVQNGVINIDKMKKLRYSLDTLLLLLREKDIFDINEVDYAIIEANGGISVLKKSQNRPITVKDMNIPTAEDGISLPLIVEGRLYEENLRAVNLTKDILVGHLKSKGLKDISEVFYCSSNFAGNIYISSYYGYSKEVNYNLRH